VSAHPWLSQTPWPTKQLPRKELTARIEYFLATHWIGVLCTTGKNGPIGSPIEYHAEGTVAYVLPQPGSPKIAAMRNDPRVCLAIHAEISGWASVRGAQLFGVAKFLAPGTPEHEQAMTIYRWQASAAQLGKPLDRPPQIGLVRIDPERIVYTEQWLRKDGFGPRQIWHRDPAVVGRSRQYGH
jgi:nitroimidazol reductase NimA-like FMN-containing flavoprotein (pyridoxamine 5'-phosphate oxidase superfamily)